MEDKRKQYLNYYTYKDGVVLRTMVDMLNKDYGLEDISNKLNDDGIRTINGKLFNVKLLSVLKGRFIKVEYKIVDIKDNKHIILKDDKQKRQYKSVKVGVTNTNINKLPSDSGNNITNLPDDSGDDNFNNLPM